MNTSFHPLVVRAREAMAHGDMRTAERATDERLKTAGRDINALGLRVVFLQKRGQFGEAARTLQTIIGIDSRADWAYSELIGILTAHGKITEAEQVARSGVRANPESAVSHNVFGLILTEMNDLPSGEWHLRRSLALGEPQPSALTNLALNLTKQGRFDEADTYFTQAHERAPEDAKTLTHWSTLAAARGNQAHAQELLDRAEAASSEEQTGLQLQRATYLSYEGKNGEALDVIANEKTLSGNGLLTRGRLHDRLGRYEEAWQDFVDGKRKLAADAGGLQYKAEAVEALFRRLAEFFTHDNIARLPKAHTRFDLAQPVFILGLPRTGTGLVEQILGAHSDIQAGGELPFLGELHKLASDLLPGPETFPENLAYSWSADRHYVATVFRDYYFARAQHFGLAGSGKFFTDRMPYNEMHLPLLKMAFPDAKIIRVVRNPLDVCVSMLANDVTRGFNCAYRIEDISQQIAASFELLEHYSSQMDLGEYVLEYERLVTDPTSSQIRSLLEYLGLPFEESCVRFHENPRSAPTPNSSPITAKLDDRSVNRHRHYEQYLKGARIRLEKMLAARSSE